MIREPMSDEKLADIHRRDRSWRIGGDDQTAGAIALDRNDLLREVDRLRAELERARPVMALLERHMACISFVRGEHPSPYAAGFGLRMHYGATPAEAAQRALDADAAQKGGE